MKIKKLIAASLCITMVFSMLFTGCGNSETTAGSAASTTSSSQEKSAAASVQTESAGNEDMSEITIVGLALSDMSGLQDVEDAINAITEKKINTHVKLDWILVGNYSQQVSLKMSSNEQVDLLMVAPIQSAAFSSLISQNQLKPIDDLLAKYGTGITDTVGGYIKGTQVNGATYAVPTYRTLNSDGYIVMRKDILDSMGLTEKAKNLTNWTDFEDIMKQVVAANPGLSGISNTDSEASILTEQCFFDGPDSFADDTTYDPLGDTYKIIASDSGTDTVFDYFESDQYYQMIKKVKQWYDEGLVYKDAATTEETGDGLMKGNISFSNVCQSEIGVETSKENATGYEVVCPKFCTIPVSTTSCTKFCWGIPVTAKEPEAAMKFLNLMYTDKDICNLLTWGIEGTDYVIKDGEACFPDGVDATNVPYHSSDFLYGNQFLTYPWEGEGADFRTTAEETLKNAGVSKYLGFTCDTTKIANQLTAVYNVVQQYKKTLESGSESDLDATYSEFKSALQAAGVDNVITEYQNQLNAWLEKNGSSS